MFIVVVSDRKMFDDCQDILFSFGYRWGGIHPAKRNHFMSEFRAISCQGGGYMNLKRLTSTLLRSSCTDEVIRSTDELSAHLVGRVIGEL